MKVAIIQPPLAGHHHRGTGVYTRLLLQALKTHTQVEVVEVKYSKLPKDADIYHFPYFDPFFLTLPWLRSKKTVLTIHDLIPLKFPLNFPSGLRGQFKWQIQKNLAAGVDHIITDSTASKRDIVDILKVDPEKVHAIYLAPDPLFQANRTQSEKELVVKKYSLPAKFALFVGDANWNKNLPNCIRAATKADVPLVIVSNSFARTDQIEDHPWNKSLLEAKKLAHEASSVIPFGNVDMHELSVLYQLAVALVIPSYYEGFGLPVVEAFASGCPVITTKRGSLDEISGEAALFVDPDDVDDIAHTISEISSKKPLAARLSQKGKLQVKKFSWQKTAQETYAVYSECINK